MAIIPEGGPKWINARIARSKIPQITMKKRQVSKAIGKRSMF
jgi:hypothetical protein